MRCHGTHDSGLGSITRLWDFPKPMRLRMTVTKALRFQFNWKPERLLALEEACVAGNNCEPTSLNLSLAAMLGVVALAMTGMLMLRSGSTQ